jgi:UDP-N-acetylmuramoyl-tripeptide--D-alanyl-D-alanine ligase
MTRWTVQQILEATDGTLLTGPAATPVRDISIDSRSLAPGAAFVAIQGERCDGHAFVTEALHRGASCLIVSRPLCDGAATVACPMVLVRDTTEALGRLARFHRRRWGKRLIAVTGSCGKTTTKELIAHLLGDPARVLKTAGTQNNQFGVPLTLLGLTDAHQAAVVEMGSNHPGEIAYLASLAEPEVAVMTNVGPVHLEFFGSVMGVLQEKLSVLGAVPDGGLAVLPGDQLDVCLEARRRMKPATRVVTFGVTDRCDLQAVDVRWSAEGMTMRLRDQLSRWVSPLPGAHNVENVLAAVACVGALGTPLTVARTRLMSFAPMPLRSELLRVNGLTILNDCYNANPLSVARALELLRELDVRRRVAIMGDMLELGAHAAPAHQAVGRLAAHLGIELIIAVGAYAQEIAAGVEGAVALSAAHPAPSPGAAPPRRGNQRFPLPTLACGSLPPFPLSLSGESPSPGAAPLWLRHLPRHAGESPSPVRVMTFGAVADMMAQLPAVLRHGDGLLIKGSRRLRLEQVAEDLRRRNACAADGQPTNGRG